MGTIWYERPSIQQEGRGLTNSTGYGKEKVESLAGLDDKAIESKVTELATNEPQS